MCFYLYTIVIFFWGGEVREKYIYYIMANAINIYIGILNIYDTPTLKFIKLF